MTCPIDFLAVSSSFFPSSISGDNDACKISSVKKSLHSLLGKLGQQVIQAKEEMPRTNVYYYIRGKDEVFLTRNRPTQGKAQPPPGLQLRRHA